MSIFLITFFSSISEKSGSELEVDLTSLPCFSEISGPLFRSTSSRISVSGCFSDIPIIVHVHVLIWSGRKQGLKDNSSRKEKTRKADRMYRGFRAYIPWYAHILHFYRASRPHPTFLLPSRKDKDISLPCVSWPWSPHRVNKLPRNLLFACQAHALPRIYGVGRLWSSIRTGLSWRQVRSYENLEGRQRFTATDNHTTDERSARSHA